MKRIARCTSASSSRRESTFNETAGRFGYSWSRPVLHFSGELDMATATTVRAAVDQACRGAHGEVMVDLSDVQFFDAMTLDIFAQAYDRLRESGGRLTLFGLSPHQEMVLRVCGWNPFW